MAAIGVHITLSGYTGKLIVVWKKNSAPLVEIGRSDPMDFPVDQIYPIGDLAPVVYLIEFWRSDDGSTLDEFVKSWEIDASENAVFGETTYEYVVNRGQSGTDPDWEDPEEGDNELHDERLIGASHTSAKVESRGTGRYRTDEIEWLPEGGFAFANTAVQFSDGDTIFVTVLNKSDLVPESNPNVDYEDVKLLQDDVDNSIDFDNTFYRKLCVANFTGPVGTIVFPDFSLIPDTKVRFQTHRGNQNYLKLQFNTGNTVYFNGEAKNVIYLPKGELIEFIFDDGACYIAEYEGNAKIRGTVIGDYKNRAAVSGAPFLLADESTGVLEGDEYPGIYDEYILSLAPGATIALADWANNKTKWGVNTLTRQFRVPHLNNLHRRFITGSDEAGDYHADALMQHYHEDGHETTATGSTFRKGATHTVEVAAGSGAGNTNQSQKSSTGGVINKADDSTYGADSATENRVKAYKEYPLIVL